MADQNMLAVLDMLDKQVLRIGNALTHDFVTHRQYIIKHWMHFNNQIF